MVSDIEIATWKKIYTWSYLPLSGIQTQKSAFNLDDLKKKQ